MINAAALISPDTPPAPACCWQAPSLDPVHDDVAALQHVGALHQRQRAADILLDQQDRGAHFVDLADLLEGDVGHDGREPQRRFVQHQEPRLEHQAAADREHLLFAATHGARKLLPAVGETR